MSNEYFIERRIKQHKLRRKARRGEIAVRRLYKFIRFLFVIFIFYAIYRIGNAHYWYLPNDIYTNPKSTAIEILGNNIVKREKIINTIKTIPIEEKPLYKINPAELTHKLESLPPVKRAYIRRYWLPSRLVIMLEEEEPAIIISPTETTQEIIAFSKSGKIIPKEYLPLDSKFKPVRILSYGTQGDDYEQWDKEKITKLYNLAYYVKTYANEDVLYIDLRQPHNIFIQLQNIKIRLGELDDTAFERIKSIQDIMPELKILKENIKYVDLAWETKYLKLDKS
ncbi:FtsQ-type POTRA domain-containing protein [bacterium]|nr:FtsQ-type POTRA domain-containing protein [bacterium]